MELNELKGIVESLIFVSEEPTTLGAILLILEQDGVTKADIETAVARIKDKYNEDPSTGIELRDVAGGYQFRTKPAMAGYIQRLNIPKPTRLSQAALETMAIIAYRQPIVRSEIEDIRGVDTGGVLKTLLERGIIKIIGKRDEAGSPLIYGTTTKFLELFDLNSLKELPTLREYADLEKERYGGGLIKKDGPEVEHPPLLEGINTTPLSEKWDKDDENLMHDLDSNIKQLRRLEKDIFPKPVETVVAVPNPEGGINATGESSEEPSTGADPATEDASGVD